MESRSYHHGDLRTALMRAAVAALERGEEVSLRAVAKAAGVSAMAPYRHFADKQALMEAVAAAGFEMLRGRLKAADQAVGPADALVGQGLAYIAVARDHPALFRLMFSRMPDKAPPPGDTGYGVLLNRVATLVAPERREAAALLCWSTVHGLANLALDGRADPLGTSDEAALRLLVDGLTSG